MSRSPLTPGGPRSTLALALGVCVLVLAGVAAPGAFGAPDPVQGFGLNVQSLLRSGGHFRVDEEPGYLALMARDGLRVARIDAQWATAEPAAPDGGGHHYQWATTDQIAGVLAAQGIRWDAVLHGSPSWASSAPSGPFASPLRARYPDFAAFAAAFAGRYGTGGTFWAQHPELPALSVAVIEIWNEPNTAVHWGVAPDPAAYAALYAGARAAIKAVDPAASVPIAGIVWNDDAAYLRGVLDALGPDAPIDGVGSHPYAPTVFSIVPNVQRVRKVLDGAGRRTTPLLLNELGWPAAYDRPPSAFALQGPVSDASRAATMALTVDALANSTCDIGNLMIYDLVEAEDNPTFVESLMGIYRRDGSSTRTSDALRDAVARYRASAAHPVPPVPVCGARGAPATRLLDLRLAVTPQAGGCALAAVTYRGLPLEEAQVRVLEPYVGVRPSAADGTTQLCPPPGGRPQGLRVVADVPGVASSNVVVCAATCRPVGAGAVCATSHTVPALGRSRTPAVVARRGLALLARGCAPQQGGAVRLRARLLVSSADARHLGLAARHAATVVGDGSVRLAPGGSATLRATLTPAARRAIRHRRRVVLTVELTATEGTTTDTTTRTVVVGR